MARVDVQKISLKQKAITKIVKKEQYHLKCRTCGGRDCVL